jgi:hypothetical protein
MSRIPLDRHPQPETHRAQRVLVMVHELHKAGYQRLRINPGLAPSGVYWRCIIYPKPEGGMGSEVRETPVARYSTGMGNRYFGWEDAQTDTAAELAAKFLGRFSTLARLGVGRDWAYAGWYVEMLSFAERGHLPIAYADWYGEPPGYLARDGERELPFAPDP